MGRGFRISGGGRVGFRTAGGVRISAGRGGVRAGKGKSYGGARAGVSYSSRGGFGAGASYGTNAVRVGTNGHRIGVGITGHDGFFSWGGGVSTAVSGTSKGAPRILGTTSVGRSGSRSADNWRAHPRLAGTTHFRCNEILAGSHRAMPGANSWDNPVLVRLMQAILLVSAVFPITAIAAGLIDAGAPEPAVINCASALWVAILATPAWVALVKLYRKHAR